MGVYSAETDWAAGLMFAYDTMSFCLMINPKYRYGYRYRRLKDFFPRSAESLRPVPQDSLGAEE